MTQLEVACLKFIPGKFASEPLNFFTALKAARSPTDLELVDGLSA